MTNCEKELMDMAIKYDIPLADIESLIINAQQEAIEAVLPGYKSSNNSDRGSDISGGSDDGFNECREVMKKNAKEKLNIDL